MIVKSLKINNLRNIRRADLRPSPKLNMFCGPNGAGKTTVIEAMIVLAKGRSFRPGTVGALVGPEEPFFRVVAEIEGSGGAHRLGLERGHSDWNARIDGRNVTQLSELSGFMPMVLMEPNSHQLVGGAPEIRRRFADWGVFHVKPAFLTDWRRYQRALRQRNAALRMGDINLVRSLEPQLVAHGAAVDEHRLEPLERLTGQVRELLRRLSPDLETVEVQYQRGWKHEDLGEALTEALDVDLERGFTSRGPHRADLVIRAGGRLARDRFSRGEQKVLAAAMILAQATLLAEGGVAPVLLLDDLASEFDSKHLESVMTVATSFGSQVFITGTSSEDYRAFVEQGLIVFHVKHGQLSDGN